MIQVTMHNYFRYLTGFLLANAIFLAIFLALRILLYLDNIELAASASAFDVMNAFFVGARFDLRMAVYACLPLVFISVIRSASYKIFCQFWLSTFAAMYLFFGLMEFEFYAEFQQRLNGLVLQYLKEDVTTVVTMIWYGLPVIPYVVSWLVISWLVWLLFRFFVNRMYGKIEIGERWKNIPLVVLLLIASILFARGTIRSGPPLRWGDAYQSDVMFLNHLALNGNFTLAKALIYEASKGADSKWLYSMSQEDAVSTTRKMILTSGDQSIDEDSATIRRLHTPPVKSSSAPVNVVIILMESFSGQYVGAVGNDFGVTPEFDALAKEGLLFTKFFSNGTHTHQGIFATLSCFPNLPGFEYLMQQPEGRGQFSGLTRLLPDYKSLFVYNGDFNWDNQYGYFHNQGLKRFIGRYDYVNPVYMDPVWGVSDEDMFNRGAKEWHGMAQSQPFYMILQSLSNHLPYSLPTPLAFEPITDQEDLSERLTAMKYSDWALGQFFSKVKESEYYSNTLFVIVGDHGFGVEKQLTEVNLLRFHVPMLIIGPGVQEMKGTHVDTVGSQVDIIPTIIGLLGKPVEHQCWGRNLFDLPVDDKGFAVIKPSGGELTVAMIKEDYVLTFDHERNANLYQLQFFPEPEVKRVSANDKSVEARLTREMEAYIQTAMSGLFKGNLSN